MSVAIEQLADEMVEMVTELAGKKKLKPSEIMKTVQERHAGEVSKKDAKEALKRCMDTGRLVYEYFAGHSSVFPAKKRRQTHNKMAGSKEPA